MNKIKAVIFDWAGTTIDYGCFAPLRGFIDGFASKNVIISAAEARGPMGLLKIDHIRALASLPRVRNEFQTQNGRSIKESDIHDIYNVFESTLYKNLLTYSKVKPHVIDTVKTLRDNGIYIGSTSGYTRDMMNKITDHVSSQGYTPDYCVCADEVSKGRPFPFMIWQNMNYFEIDNPRNVVKIGDTISDIKEGLSAGVWTVGVIMGSSELGLSQNEVEQLSHEELTQRVKSVHDRFYATGADFIINDLSELPNIVDQINERLIQYTDHKLLTPGPLTTRKSVKLSQLADHCTWDDDYKTITKSVLDDITEISADKDKYATVLLQGSGSYAVEAMIQTFTKDDEKILIIENGAYGKRIIQQASLAGKTYSVLSFDMCCAINPSDVKQRLSEEPDIKTVMFVHSETTTGLINPIKEIAQIAKAAGKTVLVDTMSSFGAYKIDMEEYGIDALASSANKCLEGLPGIAFVVAKKKLLEATSNSKSLCLDLCDQYKGFYPDGKFRFTSPTTILLALRQALDLYKLEGGQKARFERYTENHIKLISLMDKLGILPIVPSKWQSVIITTFDLGNINFESMYDALKKKGYVIYPGKLTSQPTFRIGTIGDIYKSDIVGLCSCIQNYIIDNEVQQ